MTLPKRCCVSACERRPIVSKNSPAAGEINCAKSPSVNDVLARLARAEVGLVASERSTIAAAAKELNSETKLTNDNVSNRRRKSRVPQIAIHPVYAPCARKPRCSFQRLEPNKPTCDSFLDEGRSSASYLLV